MSEKQLPLEDIRVIELGTLLAGPFSGRLLGDFGAEIIKVEPPGKSDPMRNWGSQRMALGFGGLFNHEIKNLSH